MGGQHTFFPELSPQITAEHFLFVVTVFDSLFKISKLKRRKNEKSHQNQR